MYYLISQYFYQLTDLFVPSYPTITLSLILLGLEVGYSPNQNLRKTDAKASVIIFHAYHANLRLRHVISDEPL